MGIIDRYIIRKLFGTLGFMLALLSIIVVIIDVQQKSPRIESNGFTVGYFLLNFYPYWVVYLIMTFMSILIFVSIIFFTSKLANNTEIVAIISSGASFHRFARPYFISALALAIFALGFNHFVLPWANHQKNKLEVYTYNAVDKEKILGDTEISTKISKEEYIFINSYNRKDKRGNGFVYQKYDKNNLLTHQIIANTMEWNEAKKKFIITNYLERKSAPKNAELISNGDTKELDFKHSPDVLFPDGLLAQTRTTPNLLNLINQEIEKGNKNITSYYIELHQRTSMPVAIIILTILAMSLSSEKRRGGIGLNLAIGIALAFVFVFSFEALKIVAQNNTIPPLLAMWIPNIIFAPIAIILYIRRANQ